MKKYFEQLRPMERRLAVVVIVAVILVANYTLIWRPYYGTWGNNESQMRQGQQTLKMYKDTIDQSGKYKILLQKFETQGEYVALEKQSISMIQTIQSRSIATGVTIENTSRSLTHTNDIFFIEQVQNINVVATDSQLVDFLYQLGNDPSMIRVSGLELRPDGPRQHLDGTITLVASYQRTPEKSLKNATASAQ